MSVPAESPRHPTRRWRVSRHGVRETSARRQRPHLRGVPPVRGLLPLVAGLGAWQLLVRGQSAYFPRPSLWWQATVQLWNSGALAPALVATAKTFVLSMLIATAIGTALGVLVGRVRVVDRLLGPFLDYCRVMPAAAVVPLAVLFAGYTEKMKVEVVVFSAVWPILLQVRQTAKTLNPVLLDLTRTLRLGRVARARKVLVPSLLPAVLLGLRVAAPTVLIIVLLVEIATAVPGVGALISNAQRTFQPAAAYGMVAVAGVLGLLVNALISVLEGYLLRYRSEP